MKPRTLPSIPTPLVGTCLFLAALGGHAEAFFASGLEKAKSVATVKATFEKLDSNKNGSVSAAEAKAWKVPAAVFKRHDVDGTKSLDPDEFVVLYKHLLVQAGRPVAADLASEVARIQARRRVKERRAAEKAKGKASKKKPTAKPQSKPKETAKPTATPKSVPAPKRGS